MISVIIPVYNRENHLYVCLNSVLKQTYEDFEVICVDDCSTDSSLEILKYFAKRDNRLKILKNSSNKGVSYSRNQGLKAAKGEYIFFLDSDDWISRDTFKKLYRNAKINNSDMVLYKLVRVNKNNFIFNRPAFDLSNYFGENVNFDHFTFTYKNIKQHVMNSSFAPYLKLYKKSFLDSYDDFTFPEGLVYEDVLFHIKTILRAPRLSFVPNFFYVYKMDTQKSIINDNSNIFNIFEIINLVEEFLIENKYFNELKLEFYSFKILQILQYLNKSHNEIYFNRTKEIFANLESGFTEEFKEQLKNTYVFKWDDYLKVLNSNSLTEYLNEEENLSN